MTAALTVAMRSSLSGMQVNQTALGVTSNNISNANTEGYTRKVAALETLLVAGVAGGVQVTDVVREVSDFLIRDLRDQLSARGMASVLDRYYSNAQDMFGLPESSSSISATVTELANRLQALSVDPESPNAQQDAVNAALAVTRQLNQMADSVQELRMEANQEIDALVTRANALIANIDELNVEISYNFNVGRPYGDLQDERDSALAELSEIMDVSYFTRDNKQVVVFASNGRTLIDATASSLSYTASSSMSNSVTYPGSISGIMLGTSDLTTEITSGKLKALIDMRDTILPGLGDQLDALATVAMDELNAIHNDGAAVPPPNTLTGTRAFADPATDTADLSGVVRIAVVDASGNAVGTPIDLDLDDLQALTGGPPTINEVRDAINGVFAASVPAIPGLAGATASVNASGQLVIAADNAANGIAINEGTSQEASTGFGFSHYFGLNDLLTGSATGGLASNITVRASILADPQLLVRGELASGTLANGDAAVTVGDNSVVGRLFTKFQEQLTFSQAGTLPQTTSSLSGYAAEIVSTNAHLASQAADDAAFRDTIFQDIKNKADSVSGVNVDEELGNLILFQNAYAANARMISTLSEVLEILTKLV